MLAWSLCAVWAIAGAIAYGSLIRRLPDSGGEYLFLTRLVHPSIGFLAGWISLVSGFTVPIAVAALTAILYIFPGFEEGASEQVYWACGLILVTSGCHLVGLRVGTGLQNGIVASKLLLIVVFVAWAFFATDASQWKGDSTNLDLPVFPKDRAEWLVLLGSMSWIALSYTGFNAAVYVAGESIQARRWVPLSMLLATCIVTIIYLALNVIFVFAPEPDAIMGKPNVATIAAASLGQNGLEQVLRFTIALSMVSSVFAMLLAGPRVYAKMAQEGVMPKFFAPEPGTLPVWATIFQTAFCLVAVCWGNILTLMSYLGLTLSACGALALSALFWVRLKLPEAKPIAWWETLALVTHLTITFGILAAATQQRPAEFTAMMITFTSGFLVFGLWMLVCSKMKPTSDQ